MSASFAQHERHAVIEVDVGQGQADELPTALRFQADVPNEMWQTDMTHVRLADDTDVEVLTWLDDHSRYALDVTASWS